MRSYRHSLVVARFLEKHFQEASFRRSEEAGEAGEEVREAGEEAGKLGS
jgi:hypothetical protein